MPSLHPGIIIEAAELRLVNLPLITPFVISTGTMTGRIFPLLVLKSDGLEGIAEGVMDPTPDYLEETLAGSMDFLENILLPSIVGKRFHSAYELVPYLSCWRGNHMAKAVVEMAFWDLWAKSLNIPLKHALGGLREKIDVGVSIGIAPVDTTLERVNIAVDAGYKRIKLKIARGHDVPVLSAVRNQFPDVTLTVDANTSYTLSDVSVLRALDEFALDYIEQPLAFDDLHDHAQLQSMLRTDICLDESIRSASHARKALASGAARVINIKPARVGGYISSKSIHDVSAAFDAPVWCGGMLESGIGRAHNIHLCTLPNFCKPGDISSASRYFHKDIINEPLEAVSGTMAIPANGAGIGVTLDHAFLDSVSSGVKTIRPA